MIGVAFGGRVSTEFAYWYWYEYARSGSHSNRFLAYLSGPPPRGSAPGLFVGLALRVPALLPSAAFAVSAAFPLRAAPTPRTPFAFYTTGTATRCTVRPTPRYSFILLPQFPLC